MFLLKFLQERLIQHLPWDCFRNPSWDFSRNYWRDSSRDSPWNFTRDSSNVFYRNFTRNLAKRLLQLEINSEFHSFHEFPQRFPQEFMQSLLILRMFRQSIRNPCYPTGIPSEFFCDSSRKFSRNLSCVSSSEKFSMDYQKNLSEIFCRDSSSYFCKSFYRNSFWDFQGSINHSRMMKNGKCPGWDRIHEFSLIKWTCDHCVTEPGK